MSLPALLLGFTVRSLISSIFLATWVDMGRHAVANVFVAVIANLDSVLVFFFLIECSLIIRLYSMLF